MSKEEVEKRKKLQQEFEAQIKINKKEKEEEEKKETAASHFDLLKQDMQRLNKDNTVDTKKEMQKKHIDPLL